MSTSDNSVAGTHYFNNIDTSSRNAANVYIFIYCLKTIIINLDDRINNINHLNIKYYARS